MRCQRPEVQRFYILGARTLHGEAILAELCSRRTEEQEVYALSRDHEKATVLVNRCLTQTIDGVRGTVQGMRLDIDSNGSYELPGIPRGSDLGVLGQQYVINALPSSVPDRDAGFTLARERGWNYIDIYCEPEQLSQRYQQWLTQSESTAAIFCGCTFHLAIAMGEITQGYGEARKLLNADYELDRINQGLSTNSDFGDGEQSAYDTIARKSRAGVSFVAVLLNPFALLEHSHIWSLPTYFAAARNFLPRKIDDETYISPCSLTVENQQLFHWMNANLHSPYGGAVKVSFGRTCHSLYAAMLHTLVFLLQIFARILLASRQPASYVLSWQKANGGKKANSSQCEIITEFAFKHRTGSSYKYVRKSVFSRARTEDISAALVMRLVDRKREPTVRWLWWSQFAEDMAWWIPRKTRVRTMSNRWEEDIE